MVLADHAPVGFWQVLDMLVPLLYQINNVRLDPSQSGLLHVGIYLCLLWSGERNFAVRLNKVPHRACLLPGALSGTSPSTLFAVGGVGDGDDQPYEPLLQMEGTAFSNGTHGDLLIMILYNLLISEYSSAAERTFAVSIYSTGVRHRHKQEANAPLRVPADHHCEQWVSGRRPCSCWGVCEGRGGEGGGQPLAAAASRCRCSLAILEVHQLAGRQQARAPVPSLLFAPLHHGCGAEPSPGLLSPRGLVPLPSPLPATLVWRLFLFLGTLRITRKAPTLGVI